MFELDSLACLNKFSVSVLSVVVVTMEIVKLKWKSRGNCGLLCVLLVTLETARGKQKDGERERVAAHLIFSVFTSQLLEEIL